MTVLLTPSRIAAIDVPIIGADGQAGNDGSPFGAPAHAPTSGKASAAVVDSLSGFQANETGSNLTLTPTVAGGTAGRGGSGTDSMAQNGGNDGSGGWVTLSLATLAVGTAAAPFKSTVDVSLNARGGFAGGGGRVGRGDPAGSTGYSNDLVSPFRWATDGGNGGNGGNGGGASAALTGLTAIIADPAAIQATDQLALTAVGEDGTSGGDGGQGGKSGLFFGSDYPRISGSGGRGGNGGRGIAVLTGAVVSDQGSVNPVIRFDVSATGGNGANGGDGGDASLFLKKFSTYTYLSGGNGGAGGSGGRAAAVFSQNSIQSTNGLYVPIELSASAGAGGLGGAGGSGGGSSAPGVTGPVTPGVPGVAGQGGTNGQAIIAVNANHLTLGAGSLLRLRMSASIGGVGQLLNTPGGAVLQFNGNVFRTAGGSTLDLANVIGGSAVVDVGAGTLTIAGSPVNRIGGFSQFIGTGDGDRFIDGPGAQRYENGSYEHNAETVVFRPGHGADTVDLLFPNGARSPLFNTIELDGFGAPFSTFSQVVAAAMDTGADTRIATPDGGSILLAGYHATDLTAGEFHFG